MIIYATIMELHSRTIPHFQKMNINDLIFYKKHYYKISSINYGLNTEYKLENIFIDQTISVLSNDRSIEYQKESSKLLVFLRFAEKYNSTIDYLNCGKVKKFSKIDIHSNYILEFEIYKDCNFNINQFYRIENLLKRIKNNSIELKNLKINPFLFITEEYQLISYDKAEKICQQYRILVGPETKLKAWSYNYFLQMNNSFYVIKTKYMNDMKKFTEEKNIILDSVLLQNIEKIIIDKKINNEVYKTTQYLLNLEIELTDKILDLYHDEDGNHDDNEINKYISNYEDINKIKLENEQKQAVINSIKYKFSIITGPPGTGKTEIIKCINFCFYQIFIHTINTLICDFETKYSVKFTQENKNTIARVIRDEEKYKDDIDSFIQPCIFYIKCNITNTITPSSISLIAPTGIAYVNMSRSQTLDYINPNISGTCHKVLYHILQSKKISESHNNILPKIFIADETSMLDFFIFRDLINECKKYGARLILIGDPNQLPSVGPGNILNQLNQCDNIFQIISLNKIKRQTSGQLIQNILKMKNDIITKSDFIDETMELKHVEQFVENGEINIENIIKLINKNNLTVHNSKFITYYNKKYLWNVIDVNNILQNIYNPDETIIQSPSKFKPDYIFRVRDKIIRCENDYSGKIMRANGEEAIILDYDKQHEIVKIQYSGQDDKEEEIDLKILYDHFKLNYCVTIHKSQGSQYDNIVFIIQPGKNNIDKKSIYTAISRAREKCIIISNPDEFVKLQTNDSNNKISLFLEESNKYDITSE